MSDQHPPRTILHPESRRLQALFCTALLLFSLNVLAQTAERVEAEYLGRTLVGTLVWAPESTSRSIVMLIHDTADYAGSPLMAGLQQGLAEAGINSIAITLSRGMDGRDEPFRCSELTESSHEMGIDEIGAWFDWLHYRDINPVSFLGHGRGGNQAAWFLSESDHPSFDKLVLLAPMLWDREQVAQEYEERFGASLHDVYRQAQELAHSEGGSARLRGVGFLHCYDVDVAAADFLEYYYDERRLHTPDLLGDITIPTLVLSGGRDEAMSGLAAEMADLTSDQVEYRKLEEADGDYAGDARQDVITAVVEFLNSRQ